MDLKDCLEKLEAEGRLCHVKTEVDPFHELSGIAARLEGGKVVQFDHVKGSEYPVVTGLWWNRDNLACVFGCETERQKISHFKKIYGPSSSYQICLQALYYPPFQRTFELNNMIGYHLRNLKKFIHLVCNILCGYDDENNIKDDSISFYLLRKKISSNLQNFLLYSSDGKKETIKSEENKDIRDVEE